MTVSEVGGHASWEEMLGSEVDREILFQMELQYFNLQVLLKLVLSLLEIKYQFVPVVYFVKNIF